MDTEGSEKHPEPQGEAQRDDDKEHEEEEVTRGQGASAEDESAVGEKGVPDLQPADALSREDERFDYQTEKMDFQEKDEEEREGGGEGAGPSVNGSGSGQGTEETETTAGKGTFLGDNLKSQVTNISATSASDIPNDVAINSSPSEGEGEMSSAGEGGSREDIAGGGTEGQGSEEGGGSKGESEWLDILGSGQLLKKVVRPGEGIATRPTPQSRVKIRTKGTLDGGKVVDRHSGVLFIVGDGDVIQAWDLAVSLMACGEIALVKTDARFAYGILGRSPDIPANANITYEIELLKVMDPVDFETVTEEDILQLVNKKRLRGNDLFARKDYITSINSYQKGLQMIQLYLDEQHVEPSAEVMDSQIRCWNNLAAAQMRVEMFQGALDACSNVLKYDADNVKALYRSGKVLAIMGELDRAVKLLSKAAGLNPDEKAIQVELQKTLRKRDMSKEQEKAMYRRMVEGVGEKPPDASPSAGKGSTSRWQESSWGPLPYLAVAAVVAAVGIGLAYILTQRH